MIETHSTYSSGSPGASTPVDPLAELFGGKSGGKSNFLTSFLHYREILKRNWWILVLCASVTLAAGGWYIFQKQPTYLSAGRIMVSGKVSLPDGAIYSEELSNFFGTQLELMQSEIVRKRAQARVQALNPEMKPANPDELKLQVGQQPKASIFILGVTSDDPAYSQAYLNAIMDEYISVKREMRTTNSETTLSAITDELKNLEKSLQTEEAELLAFRKDNNLGYLQEEGNGAGSYLAALEKKLALLKTEYELLTRLEVDQNVERRQRTPSEEGSGITRDGVSAQFGPLGDYMKSRQQIELVRARLADFGQYLRPKHPIMVALNNELALQQRLITTYREQSKTHLAAERESISVQIENLESQIKEWQVKALDLSLRLAQYEKIKSRYDRSKNLYDRLLGSMQSVDVNKNINQDLVSVLEKASVARPVKPGVPKILGSSLFVGLLIGAGIVLLMDQLDDKMKTTAAFQAHFSERIVGQVVREKESMTLLAPDDPRHGFAESFSNLRSALFFLPYKHARPKTLLITSALPSEGKSTVSSNLAITLAAGGSKVLLIDADLRRGQLAQRFDVSKSHLGFTGVLTEQVGFQQAIIPSGFADLDFIPRGKGMMQPSRYLLGPLMDQFIAEMQTGYDFVIFDSCPVLAADDTTSFASKLDATLFVIRIGSSSVRSCRKALEFLYNRQVNVLGTVLNAVDSSSAEYNYYRYSDYYETNTAENS